MQDCAKEKILITLKGKYFQWKIKMKLAPETVPEPAPELCKEFLNKIENEEKIYKWL